MAAASLAAEPVGAKPQPTVRKLTFEIVSVDPATGVVMAKSTLDGEVAKIVVPPSAVKAHRLQRGKKIKLTPGANGNCACGQRADGSCWCVSSIPECCGFPTCPMASCEKKQPIPG
jgi:hypothetical protein